MATWLAAIVFILILVFGWVHTKSVVERQLRDYAESVTQVAAGQAAAAFDSAQKALQDLTDTIQVRDTGVELGAQTRTSLNRLIVRSLEHNPSLTSVAVFDTGGRFLAGESRDAIAFSHPVPAQADQLFPTESNHLTAVSAPFQSSDGGKWLIQVRSRLIDANGLTAAIVVANHDIGRSFAEFTRSLPLGSDDSIALIDLNNRQVAFVSSAGVTASSAANTGIAHETTPIRYVADGDQIQLVASHEVHGYPFYVMYTKNMDSWFLRWRQEQFVLAIAVLGALVVTAAVTTGIQRRLLLTTQLQRTRGELEESNAALRATLAAAELLAARDQLTGLCNRRNFDQRLESAIARCARHGDDFSLLMIDIDHFKGINDYYGHATGDDVLRRFGEVLRERLRQNDVAARWGGEEFVVLADGACLENARLLAEQIREWVAVTTFPPVPRVTVSIGVADFQPGESGDDLLKRADRALYNAKRNGRNRVMAAESSHTVNVVKMQSA